MGKDDTNEAAELAALAAVQERSRAQLQAIEGGRGRGRVPPIGAMLRQLTRGAEPARRVWRCTHGDCRAEVPQGRSVCDGCRPAHLEAMRAVALAPAAATLPAKFVAPLHGPQGADLRAFVGAEVFDLALEVATDADYHQVLVIGPAGHGKTTLACAIARTLLAVAADPARDTTPEEWERGKGLRFVTAFSVADVRRQRGRAWQTLLEAPVLILDDIGREPKHQDGPVAELITARADSGRGQTIVTTGLWSHEVDERALVLARYDGGTVDRLFGALVIRVGCHG